MPLFPCPTRNVTTGASTNERRRVQTDETSDEAGRFRDDGAWTPLDPRQRTVLRVRFAALLLIPVIAVTVLDIGPIRETPMPQGLAPGIIALLALIGVIVLPGRRYRAWGYRESEDELFIRHGLFQRVTTVIPFGRVQHIDISQGPVERSCGVATLSLHTAGTRSAEVSLPGLARGEAERMRDTIRAQIRQDLL